MCPTRPWIPPLLAGPAFRSSINIHPPAREQFSGLPTSSSFRLDCGHASLCPPYAAVMPAQAGIQYHEERESLRRGSTGCGLLDSRLRGNDKARGKDATHSIPPPRGEVRRRSCDAGVGASRSSNGSPAGMPRFPKAFDVCFLGRSIVVCAPRSSINSRHPWPTK